MMEPALRRPLCRYSLFLCSLSAIAIVLLAGCGGNPDYIVSFQDTQDISPGAELRYEDLVLGEVIKVESTPDKGGADVYLSLEDSSLRRFVKTDARFIVRRKGEATMPYVELVVFDKESALLPVGSKVIGAENELELRVEQFKANWWKNLIVVAVAVLVLLALVYLFRIFLKFGAIITALISALIGANYLSGYLARVLGRHLPPDYRPDVVAFVVMAVAIYFGVAMLFWLLLAPFRRKTVA